MNKSLTNNELNNEITNYYNGEEMETVYIGGGTPSSLSYDELNKLFKILSVVKVSNNYEYSFECNPDDITEELIDILIKNRVNRISIGIESFDKDNLGFMERSVDFKDIQNKINMIRSKGMDNINLDLIYGIPGENIKTLKKDLKLMVKLKPKHISTYSLQIEEHTKIYNEGINPIDEDLDSKMYFTIIKYLKKKGYNHYEISNFSLKGYESSHNLSYWNNEEYYGFGLGASGYVDGFRYDNTRNLNKYLSGDYHKYESLLGNDDKMYDVETKLLYQEEYTKLYDKYIVYSDNTVSTLNGDMLVGYDHKNIKLVGYVQFNEDIFREKPEIGLITTKDDLVFLQDEKHLYIYNKEIKSIEQIDGEKIQIIYKDNTYHEIKGYYTSLIDK